MNRRACLLIACAVVQISLSGAVAGAEASAPTWERDVRPIFKAQCFHCHGEDKELSGGLDLRLRRMIATGGDAGAAIVPGDHAASLLFEYVRSGDMPPAEEQRLSEEEVETIARWIDAGAPVETAEPEQNPQPGEFLMTPADRSHWAFRPIQKPAVPASGHDAATANPVDAFLAEKLAAKNLQFSPAADRVTLIRRATFDLLGLPPTPEEVERFLADDSPDAWAKLIDRLLESPHYGERWGRHWLDVAGYADSEGYNDADLQRPDAWRYRDYVVRSFNADKPWDQFIVEQLAGDELARATHANAQGLANRDAAACEQLTATGFLRMAPDGTGSRPDDVDLARQEVVTETIKIVTSSLMGMTVACAECHDHRFDPIPQEDFYRLRAIFAPVYDAENWRNPSSRRAAILSDADRKQADELEARAKELDAQHDQLKQEVLDEILGRVLEGVPEEEREYARTAFQTPAKERSPEQKKFLEETYPMLGLLAPGRLHLFLARFKDGNDLKQGYEEALAEAAKIRAQKPQPEYIRVATEDPKHVPQTHLFYRGDRNSPEPEVIPPGDLTVLGGVCGESASSVDEPACFPADDPDLPTTGRRLAFAKSLTSGDHPLTARVLVNRFWAHHFGAGLVESMGDFGTRTPQPVHSELLDWLAADFMEQGWRLKRLHRLLMTSQAYQQSSDLRAEAAEVDPDNRLLWRMPVQRLEAELVRDAMLAVSGRLNPEMHGAPAPVTVDAGGIVTVGDGGAQGRERKRSLYIEYRRTQPVAMLEAFDLPELAPNCEQRLSSTVATQSLALLNSNFALEEAEAFADRVLAECGEKASADEQIDWAWRLAFGVSPDEREQPLLAKYLQEQREELTATKQKSPERLALASLCQVIFGSNRFLYVD